MVGDRVDEVDECCRGVRPRDLAPLLGECIPGRSAVAVGVEESHQNLGGIGIAAACDERANVREPGKRDRAVAELQHAAAVLDAYGALRYRDEAEREAWEAGAPLL